MVAGWLGYSGYSGTSKNTLAEHSQRPVKGTNLNYNFSKIWYPSNESIINLKVVNHPANLS